MRGYFLALRGSDPSERGNWLSRWAAWSEGEPWAHPTFLELFKKPGEEAVCLVWDEPGREVLFPVILRPIPANLPRDRAACDVTGPYGYGGPFLVGRCSPSGDSYWGAVETWARSRGVVSLFSRLTLFEADLAEGVPGKAIAGENVIRELSLDDDCLWLDYEHKVRKNVKRARKEGVSIQFDPTGERLSEFHEIYTATMDRRAASSFYDFGRDWFGRLIEGLPGRLAFFHAVMEGRVISTELVLLSRSHVYSFLGGTLPEHFERRPNDLLKHEIIRWGRDTGRTHFVLGGGFLSGGSGGVDGILRYKMSFAPGSLAPFSVMKWIVDERAYSELVEVQRADAQAKGIPWSPREGFFPMYRA